MTYYTYTQVIRIHLSHTCSSKSSIPRSAIEHLDRHTQGKEVFLVDSSSTAYPTTLNFADLLHQLSTHATSTECPPPTKDPINSASNPASPSYPYSQPVTPLLSSLTLHQPFPPEPSTMPDLYSEPATESNRAMALPMIPLTKITSRHPELYMGAEGRRRRGQEHIV